MQPPVALCGVELHPTRIGPQALQQQPRPRDVRPSLLGVDQAFNAGRGDHQVFEACIPRETPTPQRLMNQAPDDEAIELCQTAGGAVRAQIAVRASANRRPMGLPLARQKGG